MNREGFQAFIDAAEWVKSKTMPKWPHQYAVRTKCRSDQEFANAVEHIRANGYVKPFYRKQVIYYNHDETYFYWTMPSTVSEAGVINRATFEQYPDWPTALDIKPGTIIR